MVGFNDSWYPEDCSTIVLHVSVLAPSVCCMCILHLDTLPICVVSCMPGHWFVCFPSGVLTRSMCSPGVGLHLVQCIFPTGVLVWIAENGTRWYDPLRLVLHVFPLVSSLCLDCDSRSTLTGGAKKGNNVKRDTRGNTGGVGNISRTTSQPFPVRGGAAGGTPNGRSNVMRSGSGNQEPIVALPAGAQSNRNDKLRFALAM